MEAAAVGELDCFLQDGQLQHRQPRVAGLVRIGCVQQRGARPQGAVGIKLHVPGPEPLAPLTRPDPAAGRLVQILGGQQVIDPHLEGAFAVQGVEGLPLLQALAGMHPGDPEPQGMLLGQERRTPALLQAGDGDHLLDQVAQLAQHPRRLAARRVAVDFAARRVRHPPGDLRGGQGPRVNPLAMAAGPDHHDGVFRRDVVQIPALRFAFLLPAMVVPPPPEDPVPGRAAAHRVPDPLPAGGERGEIAQIHPLQVQPIAQKMAVAVHQPRRDQPARQMDLLGRGPERRAHLVVGARSTDQAVIDRHRLRPRPLRVTGKHLRRKQCQCHAYLPFMSFWWCPPCDTFQAS